MGIKDKKMIAEFTYSLQRYAGRRTRHTCAKCGKAHEFTLYVDGEGQPLAPHVGKCNRENNCGYHYTPGQFFADNPTNGEAWKQSELWRTVYTPPEEKPVTFLPVATMQATLKAYRLNNFVRYLIKLFGEAKALELAKTYCLGTSKKWQNDAGLSVVFWQIDAGGNIRQAKVMAYNPETGRRLKEDGKSYVAFLGKQIAGPDAELQQCFFGEHLLPLNPAKPVCIVESEKTAVIMAGFAPDAVWLATGGKNGARWTEKSVYKALQGRQVVLYPDLGAYEDWKEKSKLLAIVADVSVSDLLERKAGEEERRAGYDIADYFTAPQIDETGEAVNGEGTPQGLPEGFRIVNGVIEVDGLPLAWLNENEEREARRRMAGRELEIFTLLNPAASTLVNRLGLKVDH